MLLDGYGVSGEQLVTLQTKKTKAPDSVSSTGVNDDIGEDVRLALFRSQFEIRQLEKRAYDMFLQNLVKGTSHLAIGQEAIAAGFATAMSPDDYTYCT